MSEIPFVNRLGDAIEAASTAHLSRRQGRLRRRLLLGGLGIALAAGSVAATWVFSGNPEQLASTSVGCYEQAGLDGNVTIVSAGDRSPVAACAQVLRTDRPLVACAARGHVAVLPGRGREACEKAGLSPLPVQYASARARVNAFARDVAVLESSADCIPSRRLASRVQALLDRSPGWFGWRVWLRSDLDRGPCGAVTMPGGDGSRTIEGALDPQGHRVQVFPTAARSTTELLYGGGGLAPHLQDASGARCYTRSALERLVRRRIVPTDRALMITTKRVTGELSGARGRRLNDGCAIVSEVYAATDGYGIVVAING